MKMQSRMLKHVVEVFIAVLKVNKRADDLPAPFWTDCLVKSSITARNLNVAVQSVDCSY
jgi:hypothetical protein